jgi:Protein of unknown function (DUF3485)
VAVAASGVGRRPAQGAIAFVALAVLPALAYGSDLLHSSVDTVSIRWPAAPPGWSGPEPVSGGEWAPQYLHPSARAFERYLDADGRSVELFTVAYRTQTQRAKLLDYDNSLLGGADPLRPVSHRIVDSPAGRWSETQVADSTGTQSIVWSRYRIGARLFVRGRLSELWYGLSALLGRPLSSLTALRTVCAPDCGAARTRLAAATALQPALGLEAHSQGQPP